MPDTWHILKETFEGSNKAAPLTLCGTLWGGPEKGSWKLEDVDCSECIRLDGIAVRARQAALLKANPPELEVADYVFIYTIELETPRNPIEYGPFVTRQQALDAMLAAEQKYAPHMRRDANKWEVLKAAVPRSEALRRLEHASHP